MLAWQAPCQALNRDRHGSVSFSFTARSRLFHDFTIFPQGEPMARRTASSKSSRTQKKTGPATQRLDPSRLFSSQYPPAQLYETWVQQLRDRLATAAAGEAAALSQELALECRARDVAVRRAAMIENIWKAREAEAADKAGQKPDLLHMFKTNLEHQRLMDQLNDLAREGSVIASHALGALILENPVTRLDPGAPRLNDPNKDREKEREKAREKALQDAGAFLSFAAERGFTPAYSDLARWYRNREEHEAAEQWLAKALKAKEPPALLEAGEILLMPVPLPADTMQPSWTVSARLPSTTAGAPWSSSAESASCAGTTRL